MANNTDIVSLKLADYQVKDYTNKPDRKGWVNYGVNNDFPKYLRELSQTTPVHGALCTAISRMIAGKGIVSTRYQNRLDALGVDTLIDGLANDLKVHGGFYFEVIWTLDRTGIAKLKHLPYENCRLAIEGDDEVVTGVYYSKDWQNTRKKANTPVFIPRFNSMNKQDQARQVYWSFGYTGTEYYPLPDYWGAVNYIELERQISMYHVNNIMNGLFPSFIVNFFNGEASPEQKQQMMRDWENKLSGARNSGKFIMVYNESDAQKPDITPFPLSDADKQYQFLSDEATKKTMIAHGVTTPLLFGIRDQTGFGSNKDEMAVGLEIFTNHVIEPAQRIISDAITDVLKYEISDVEFTITPNTPIEEQKAVQDEGNAENVAASALNGAQIESLINIVIQAVTDAVPISTAKAIVTAGFPTLTTQQIDAIFKDVIPGSVQPTEIVQNAVLNALFSKKKVSDLDEFISLGEDAPEGYFILDVSIPDEANDDAENAALNEHKFTSTGSARPNAKSEQDEKVDNALFITRYRYRGELGANTREFCRKMLSANKLYRKEDIVAMENKAVNPGWGPKGANTYSVWLYKGGGDCHHFWQKEVYMSIEGSGIDVNNPNARNIAVSKAERMGYKVRNESLVAKLPVDMPFNGFLPDNPRFQ